HATRSFRASVFSFRATPTTQIYPLSLHDALPISADLEVVIGVGINGHCYTVGDAVINALEAAGLPKESVESHQDGFDLDLKAVNRHQAIMAGVGADSVHVTEIGTEDTERFFSYRLESGVTGRALAFIGRK